MEWPTTTQQATLRALQHVQRREAVSVTKNARRARESALVGTACLVAAKPTIANHVRDVGIHPVCFRLLSMRRFCRFLNFETDSKAG
jgi:hypothetical protein